jgi:hypothetical protein
MRAQIETERTPKLSGSMFISMLAATQWTHVQRLSPENKGDLPYIPFRAGYRNVGVHLLQYIITCYFMAQFNLWD